MAAIESSNGNEKSAFEQWLKEHNEFSVQLSAVLKTADTK